MVTNIVHIDNNMIGNYAHETVSPDLHMPFHLTAIISLLPEIYIYIYTLCLILDTDSTFYI